MPPKEEPQTPPEADTFHRVRDYDVGVALWPEEPDPEEQISILRRGERERSKVEPIRSPEEPGKRR